jgi:hypothetical protein
MKKFKKRKAKKSYADRRFEELTPPTLEVVQMSALDDDELDRESKVYDLQLKTYTAESDSILGYKKLEVEDMRSKREERSKIAQAAAYIGATAIVVVCELKGELLRSGAYKIISRFMK